MAPSKRKKSVFLTNDMRVKVAQEYIDTPHGKKQGVLDRYNISRQTACSAVRDLKAGTLAKASSSTEDRKLARELNCDLRVCRLLDLYDEGVLTRAETEDFLSRLVVPAKK